MDSDYVYVLYVFDKHSEALVEDVELNECEPEFVKNLLGIDNGSPPYIYDAHPIIESSQIDALRPYLPAKLLDLEKYVYMVEANSV